MTATLQDLSLADPEVLRTFGGPPFAPSRGGARRIRPTGTRSRRGTNNPNPQFPMTKGCNDALRTRAPWRISG
jgi:hypothetical protein